MKKTLLFVLALAVIPVGVNAQALDIEEVRAFAEEGVAAAQHFLGSMYFDGDGVPRNEAEAARWYRLAAEQGYSEAQSALGVMYLNGRGVPEDGS